MVKRRFWLTIILALTLACMLIAPAAAPGKALAVTTVTGRMSPQVQISTPHTPDTDRFSPQAAYNTARREFLVVYGNQVSSNQIIQGQRVDSHLNKIGGEFNITMGGLYDWAPAVAYNSQEGVYLVVFAHDVSAAHDLSQCDIQGQFVNWNGALLGSNFTIQTWEGVNFVYPKVAYNHQRNEYLVVWKAKNINDHSTAIGMKILLNNGSTWYGTILASDGNPDTPDVIWDPIHFQYLVVWEYFNSQNKLAIAADLHDTYGNRLTPPGILKIAGDANNDYSSPHPAYSNDWYGIVMEKKYSPTDHDIYSSFIFFNGSSVLGPVAVDASVFDDGYPVIAGAPVGSGGQEFIILFNRAVDNGYSAWMRPITAYLAGEARPVCNSFSYWDCHALAIAKGGAGYLMLYFLDSVTRHVFGRMFWQFNLNLPTVLK